MVSWGPGIICWELNIKLCYIPHELLRLSETMIVAYCTVLEILFVVSRWSLCNCFVEGDTCATQKDRALLCHKGAEKGWHYRTRRGGEPHFREENLWGGQCCPPSVSGQPRGLLPDPGQWFLLLEDFDLCSVSILSVCIEKCKMQYNLNLVMTPDTDQKLQLKPSNGKHFSVALNIDFFSIISFTYCLVYMLHRRTCPPKDFAVTKPHCSLQYPRVGRWVIVHLVYYVLDEQGRISEVTDMLSDKILKALRLYVGMCLGFYKVQCMNPSRAWLIIVSSVLACDRTVFYIRTFHVSWCCLGARVLCDGVRLWWRSHDAYTQRRVHGAT